LINEAKLMPEESSQDKKIKELHIFLDKYRFYLNLP
jgi:hypothetical protein